MKKAFSEVDIDSISIKTPFREALGDVTSLEASIRKYGLLYPLIVDRNNVLIVGQRRLQACRNVGLRNIPVLKLDIDGDSMAALDIRSDLSLCRMALSDSDLEKLIESKKRILRTESKPWWSASGLLLRLRRHFPGK